MKTVAVIGASADPAKYGNKAVRAYKQQGYQVFPVKAFDEDWKCDVNDPLGAEKHWGLFTIERKAKLAMQN
jgi:exo-beta-1,3-glucanase (GH17 family)